MNAPVIWIGLPALAGLLLWGFRREPISVIIGASLCAVLALTAWLVPFDTVHQIGSLSVKIGTSLEILGRRLVLGPADQPLLAIIYGGACFWFAAAAVINAGRRLVPFGLLITSLLVASQAVEPFLFAALLIETAILVTVILLRRECSGGAQGLQRFLIFQTLAMPFLLLSGWQLSGIEASPGNLMLVRQAAIMIGLGFVLLLGVFPFHTWIPMLAGEAPIYPVGFLLWLLPLNAFIFVFGFLDSYAWLRDSSYVPAFLKISGMLMTIGGALFALFQKDVRRLLSFLAIFHTGLSLISLSTGSLTGVEHFFLQQIPYTLSLGLACLSLAVLIQAAGENRLESMEGTGRRLPLAAAGLLLALASMAGLPLLAGFPVRIHLLEDLAAVSPASQAVLIAGSLGVVLTLLRVLGVLLASPSGNVWKIEETLPQRVFLIAGSAALVLFGVFPFWAGILTDRLPVLFEFLGY